MNNLELLMEYLPFFIPLFILQIGLLISALIHVLKHRNYRFGNRILWVVVVVFINILGPILYFTIGKGDE